MSKIESASGFCPILTKGPDAAIECSHDCAWFNPTVNKCDVSVIADYLIREPEQMQRLLELAEDQEEA